MKKSEKGITLVVLIITVILLLVLVTVTLDIIVDRKVFENADDVVEKSQTQIEDQKQMVNEVRELYN